MYHPQLQTLLNAQLDKYQKQPKGRDFRDFATRLSANLHRITEVLNLIYGRRQEHPDYLEKLLDKLFECYQARPKALKAVDRQREKEADWLLSEKIVGMSLYVDRFSEDLEGFKEKIDYLEELGVNWIHLMPLLEAPAGSNDGGYAVSNYRKVDSRFGTMEDIRKISEIFRERGMLLTLDLVMNHTSDQHEWAQKALRGDAHYQEYFYFFDDRSLPDQYEQSLPEVFPTSAPGNFTFQPQLGKWVMTVFHNYQWDLNYRNPEVLIEMLANLLFLANQGVDIIRIDAPAFIWKQMGTDSQNLPEAHLLLQLVKACSQVVAPGVAFIAEAIVAPQEIIKYFGEGPQAGRECEIAYNATFMALLWEALATQDTRLLRRGLSELPAKPYGTTWITYVRCHDDIGLGYDDQDIYAVGYDPQAHREFLVNYYSGKFQGSPATGAPFMSNPKTGDARISGSLASLAGLESALAQQDEKALDLAVGRVLMLQGLALAYGGLPMLYYGDELGTINDYSYQDDPDKAYDNRWMHRPLIDWSQAARRKEEGRVAQRIFEGMKHLIRIRKRSSEFADRNSFSLENCDNKHIFSFLRWDMQGSKTLVLANFHPSQQFVSKEILRRCGFSLSTGIIDKISGKPPREADGLLLMEPYQMYWICDRVTYEAQEMI